MFMQSILSRASRSWPAPIALWAMVPLGLAAAPLGAQQPDSAQFQLSILGFTVNRQTVDNALQADGAGDEVFYKPNVWSVDAAGRVTPVVGGTQSSVMGQQRGGAVRAGSASSTGGLRTSDGFPSADPSTDRSAKWLVWRGTLMRHVRGIAVTPTIWEWDDNNLELEDLYAAGLRRVLTRELSWGGVAVASGNAAPYRPFARRDLPVMRVESGRVTGIGGAKNRPIGMVRRGDQFAFQPDVIVLTYESATALAANGGVLRVQYKEDEEMQGNYTLVLLVERLDK
jgi:hypothetical protein